MKWAVDHAAISTRDVGASRDFYRIFGMEAADIAMAEHPDNPMKPEGVAIMFDHRGASLHVIENIPNFHAEFTGFEHNPTAPHAAISVADIDRVTDGLARSGWGYMKPRAWGPTGFVRLYTAEPDDNLIEICASPEESGVLAAHGDLSDAPWLLDHVAIPSRDVEESAKWLRDIFGLRIDHSTSSEVLASFPEEGTGRLGVRVMRPDPFYPGPVNPTMQQHFAITVRDFDGVASALTDNGIPFTFSESDTHSGGQVLWVYDDAANLIQVRPHL